VVWLRAFASSLVFQLATFSRLPQCGKRHQRRCDVCHWTVKVKHHQQLNHLQGGVVVELHMVPTSIAALQAGTAKSAQAGAGTGLGRAA
jgi:hypothetical protein